MKKTFFLLSIISIMFIVACSNSDNKTDNNTIDNSENLSKFLSNFKNLQLPFSSEQFKPEGKIEKQFLSILTDTTGGFSDSYPDGEIHFKTEYFYVGKINTENKNFHIIIVAEIKTIEIFALTDMMPTLIYNLYTLGSDGKIISSIELSTAEYESKKIIDGKALIDKGINIKLQNGSIEKNYKINEQGKIELVSEKDNNPTLTFTDSRDGHVYKTVKIGNQTWLAENFAYKPQTGKFGGLDGTYWVYADNKENLKNYGYLYDWETAQTVAPEGWHLPTKEEFETLINFYGKKAFDNLTQELNVVYSGWFYDEIMDFAHEGNEVGFWSATKEDDKNALLCIFEREYKHIFIRSRFTRGVGAAIRLIKNDADYNAQNINENEDISSAVPENSPKTDKGDFSDILTEFNEIIKGDGYTTEKPSIKRMFTEVVLKKKNGQLKMVQITESDSHYENQFQYFYKNNKLFYAYIKFSNSDETDNEGNAIFITKTHKLYFKDDECQLCLSSDNEQDFTKGDYDWKEVLKNAKDYLKRTENNEWSSF